MAAAASPLFLLLAGGVALAIVRPNLPRSIPDIPVYLAVGMACGMSGLGGQLVISRADDSAAPILEAVKFVALYLLIFSSCGGLRLSQAHRHVAEITTLVGASVIAFVLALASVPFLAALVPDPAFTNASEGTRKAHLIVMSLGVMVCSLPFLTKIFINTKLQHSRFASNILLAACFVDIVVWAIFSAAVALSHGKVTDFGSAPKQILLEVGLIVATSIIAVIEVQIVAHLLRSAQPHVKLAAMLALSGSIIALMGAFSIAPIVGMVVSGLVLGCRRDVFGAGIELFERLSTVVGAPLYFTCVGFGINLSTAIDPAAIVLFCIWSSAIKISTISITAKLIRRAGERALDYGIAMNTRGGPGLVLAAAAYSSGLVGVTSFISLITASIATAIFTESYLKRAAGRILVPPH